MKIIAKKTINMGSSSVSLELTAEFSDIDSIGTDISALITGVVDSVALGLKWVESESESEGENG